MRFQSYLIETNIKGDVTRSKEISGEKAVDIIRTKCRNSLKGTIIERSFVHRIHDPQRYLYVEPSKFERYSKNTSNEYTILVDHILPSWKKFPKRSKSIVCRSIATYQTYNFVVFPFDGSKIGVCPSNDFWYSFKRLDEFYGSYGYGEMFEFNQIFGEIGSLLSLPYNYLNTGSMKSFLKMIDEPQYREILEKGRGNLQKAFHSVFLGDYLVSGKTFIQFLNDLLDPYKNGFKIWTAGDTFPIHKEVWMEGNSVLINPMGKPEFITDILGKVH